MSVFSDKFGFFDPKQDFSVTYGQLPHWEQAGATYFVTYRTIDSIPQDAIHLWQREQEASLRRLGVCKSEVNWQSKFQQLDWDKKRAFHRQNATKVELLLDELNGKCELRDPVISQIVAENLRYFDGDRYELGGSWSSRANQTTTVDWSCSKESPRIIVDAIALLRLAEWTKLSKL